MAKWSTEPNEAPSNICWQCGWVKDMCKCYRSQVVEDNPYEPDKEEPPLDPWIRTELENLQEELEDAQVAIAIQDYDKLQGEVEGIFDRLQDEYTGWSSEYYELPEGATELQDLIEHREMNFAIGNIFKAAYRLGNKEGSSREYDLNKIIWFAQRELNRLKGENS